MDLTGLLPNAAMHARCLPREPLVRQPATFTTPLKGDAQQSRIRKVVAK
jgi:hypothetical protein